MRSPSRSPPPIRATTLKNVCEEELEKQKEILQSACRKAGARIKELERDREFLKGDIDRLTEDKHNLETMLRK